MLKTIKNKNGFIAIESIIVMAGVLAFIVLFIALISYTLPRIALEKEVQALAQVAKKQGGLTNKTSEPQNSDIELFKESISKMGYDKDKITIEVKTIPSGMNAIGVTPINGSGTNYIRRDSKELMEVIVSIPADKSTFNFPLKFMGVKNTLSGVYSFREVVGSERW